MSKCRCFPGEHIPQCIDVHDDKAGEPALWLVLKESDARKIVSAVETGHAYEVVAILKNQPWWTELAAAVRGLRYRRMEMACPRQGGAGHDGGVASPNLSEGYGSYESA